MKKAVFLDKDGTLIYDEPYNVDPSKIQIKPGVVEGLKLLKNDFLLIIVTNQSGVARGIFSEVECKHAIDHLLSMFRRSGVEIDGYYYCPHHPDGTVEEYAVSCRCRKPKPGMLLMASEQHALNLTGSWMIGDSLSDVEAGAAAGCSSVLLVTNGDKVNTELYDLPSGFQRQILKKDFLSAARFIAGRA